MSKKKLLDRIVGSGFLANNFKKHESLFEKLNVCVYAAGVSNSQCVSSDLLEKDKKRLFNFKTRISENQMLIYFSTCSVNDPSRNKTPYIKNKINAIFVIIHGTPGEDGIISNYLENINIKNMTFGVTTIINAQK